MIFVLSDFFLVYSGIEVETSSQLSKISLISVSLRHCYTFSYLGQIVKDFTVRDQCDLLLSSPIKKKKSPSEVTKAIITDQVILKEPGSSKIHFHIG